MAEKQLNAAVEISVSGTPVRVDFEMPEGNVKLRRMLPVFQQISNTFVRLGVESVNETGKQISCRAGCGACCRQLVPLSEAEAYRISELVDSMEEPRRSEVRERFSGAMATLESIGYFSRLENAAELGESAFSDIVDEYFTYQIACPFLVDESCSIHAERPIACREYLVTSPPEHCSSAKGEQIENVQHLFKVKDAVILLSKAKTSESLPYVPMIRSLEWASRNPDETPEKDSKEWVGEFFGELRDVSGLS